MKNNKFLSLSVILLAISIIFGAFVISHSINNMSNKIILGEGYVLNLEETAKYLKIDKIDLIRLISKEGSKIPYKQVGGKYLFDRRALDQWLLIN